MIQIRKQINRGVEVICIGILGMMVLLVGWQVFSRYIMNDPSSFSESLTRYLFVWLVIISATYSFGSRDHMCISFLKEKLSAAHQRLVNILIELITIAFALCVMTIGGIRITMMQMVHLDSNLQIPTGLIYSVIPICGVLIIFYCICNLRQDWMGIQNVKGRNR